MPAVGSPPLQFGGPMSTFMKALLALNLLIAASYLVTRLHAQRPPELDATGAAYLRVNINPTDIPLMITYLHLPQQTVVTLAAETDSHSMNLGAAGQITTAIYLRSNQRLDFDSEIMYSGCRPD